VRSWNIFVALQNIFAELILTEDFWEKVRIYPCLLIVSLWLRVTLS
jgi:hypothetical protein